jgi:hypothetical protein
MDIQNPRLLYLKGGLFVLLGVLSSVGILLTAPTLRIATLLVITIWSFSRAYYFAFYVVEHYADPGYRFSGLCFRYALKRRTRNHLKRDPK